MKDGATAACASLQSGLNQASAAQQATQGGLRDLHQATVRRTREVDDARVSDTRALLAELAAIKAKQADQERATQEAQAQAARAVAQATQILPSKLVVVVGDLTSRIAELFAVCAPFQQLTKVDADGVARIWKRMWSGMDWTGPYTGHSVKRGALGHILRAMAAGAQVREELVSRVCKHATLAGLSNQTIRYGSGTKADLISLARAMETAKVTCLL